MQARVKPLAFDGSARFVGISARTSGATKFYRLALLNTNRAELQAVNGSSVTVIGGVNRTVSTGTWYTLRIDVSGTTISGFVNGTQIALGHQHAGGRRPDRAADVPRHGVASTTCSWRHRLARRRPPARRTTGHAAGRTTTRRRRPAADQPAAAGPASSAGPPRAAAPPAAAAARP